MAIIPEVFKAKCKEALFPKFKDATLAFILFARDLSNSRVIEASSYKSLLLEAAALADEDIENYRSFTEDQSRKFLREVCLNFSETGGFPLIPVQITPSSYVLLELTGQTSSEADQAKVDQKIQQLSSKFEMSKEGKKRVKAYLEPRGITEKLKRLEELLQMRKSKIYDLFEEDLSEFVLPSDDWESRDDSWDVSLDLSGKGITKLVFGEKEIKITYKDRSIQTMPLPAGLEEFKCSYNDLTELKGLPKTVKSLNCRQNQHLTHLDFPPKLVILDYSGNKKLAIKKFPDSLEELRCDEVELSKLVGLPQGLRVLRCYGNKLTSLGALPEKLAELYCGRNQLTNLGKLPQALKRLECYGNQLTKLEKLPLSLEALLCARNKLIELVDLPDGLEDIDCSDNQLTELRDLPRKLNTLNCSGNKLVVLEDLPYGLETLNCSNNKLTKLGNLPASLKELYCAENNLVRLEDLPRGLEELDYADNPLKYVEAFAIRFNK